MTDSDFVVGNCKHCGHTYQQHTVPTHLHIFACGETDCDCIGFSQVPAPPPPPEPKTYQVEDDVYLYITKNGVGVLRVVDENNLPFAKLVCDALNDVESRDSDD